MQHNKPSITGHIAEWGSIRICTDTADIFLPIGPPTGHCRLSMAKSASDIPRDAQQCCAFILRSHGYASLRDTHRDPAANLVPGRYQAYQAERVIYLLRIDENMME